MKAEHYEKINGYPNEYWGWGAEDEVCFQRAQFTGMTPFSASLDVARYKNILSIFEDVLDVFQGKRKVAQKS